MPDSQSPILAIIVPCYNEDEVLIHTNKNLCKKLETLINGKTIHTDSFIAYVNDGSSDETWTLIEKLNSENKQVKGVNLSRNYGHQAALLAGVESFFSTTDCIVTIDADLQDDIHVIDTMVENYSSGFDVVYGVRDARKTDSFFKRNTALAFYKIMKFLGVDVIYNHADFRLTSKRFNQELIQFDERNLFLRGIVPTIGFKQTKVLYDRKEREAGETKYPFRKMVSFALEGITSFSVRPLRLITISGLIIFIICLGLSAVTLISYINGDTIRGWASTVLPFFLLGGLQIFFIGIIGEYIGKIYKEIKKRPRFIIESIIN